MTPALETLHWNGYGSFGVNDPAPTIWNTEVGDIGVVVHRIKGYEGWFVTIRNLGVIDKRLESTDVVAAKMEGLQVLADYLRNRISVYRAALKAMGEPSSSTMHDEGEE